MGCDHNCANCGGCETRDLSMTKEEIEILQSFAVLPFQPVARKASEETPVCREYPQFTEELTGNLLLLLEKKGLIEIDYKIPLAGFGYEDYPGLPVHGSMALTERGQTALELLEMWGAQE